MFFSEAVTEEKVQCVQVCFSGGNTFSSTISVTLESVFICFCLFKAVQLEMVSTCCVHLLCRFICGDSVTKSVTMSGVNGEGLPCVCTELPSGHRFKTVAQDQSQSESSAP